MTSPVLVGRSSVMAQVRSALDATRAGTPRHLVIGGEAGVGKTRVLDETRRAAEDAEMRVLLGGCVSVGEECLPFAPYAEIIRTLIARDGVAGVRAIVARAGADLARLVPALGGGEAPPDQELWAQTRLYEALFELFRRYAEQSPLVIGLEDMHWADSDTLAATSFLLRAIHDEPISVVVTFRADEVTREHPLRAWLAEISRDGAIERIELEPLGAADSATLVREILGRDLSTDELDEIRTRSDGNAFFIEELLASRESVGEALPALLRDVLLARIDVLPGSARDLLGIASVGGRVVEHDALVAVSGRSEAEIAKDVREVVDAGLLVPTQALDEDDAYTFRHALLLEAVYEGMLPTERRRLHRAWGDVLASHDGAGNEGGAGYLLQLAHHWREGRDERALSTTIDAAAAAVRGFSFDLSAREHEAAPQLWDEDDPRVQIDHVELLERTARASYLGSRYRQAVIACRAAIAELGDADAARLTALLILLARTQWVSGDWGASVLT